jgi:hypothetical protein
LSHADVIATGADLAPGMHGIAVQKVDVAQWVDGAVCPVNKYTAAPPEEQNDRLAARFLSHLLYQL